MIRLTLVVAVAMHITATLHAQEPPKAAPVVKRILDEAARDVRANRLVFEKANQKPLGTARQKLQDMSTRLIQEGKTAEAQAILKQVETLEADVLKLASGPPPANAGRVPAQTAFLEKLVGRWDRRGHPEYLQVASDGRAALHRDSDNGVAVTGQLAQAAPDSAEIRWQNGYRWQIRMAGENSLAVVEMSGADSSKATNISLERVQ